MLGMFIGNEHFPRLFSSGLIGAQQHTRGLPEAITGLLD
jgi:hypothetical protein